MSDDPIAQLVAGVWPDPDADGAAPLDVGVRSVVIDDSLDGREADLIGDLDLGHRLAVVSDPDTHEALGARVERALGAAFQVDRVVLPRHPHPDEDTVVRLEAALPAGTDALVAIGSGTINDLCKLVAFRRDRPYVVFGTAPSMNGYTSVSASIMMGAFKRSVRTRAPAGAFFDLDVACRAPVRLIRSGLGECLCRATAQTDWLMAHLLLGTPYREAPFALLAAEEDELLSHPDALIAGDRAIMTRMVRTLVLSGFGMTIAGGSHPASQGEHLISHYVEMMWPEMAAGSFHGEQMAITTQFMAGLQQRILALDRLPPVRPTPVARDELIARYGEDRGARCFDELERKSLSPVRAAELDDRLASDWDRVRGRLAGVARRPEALAGILARAGAPIAPGDLGWPPDRFRAACGHAREIRDRFTFLDLAAALGLPAP